MTIPQVAASLLLGLLAGANLWHTIPMILVGSKASFKDVVTAGCLFVAFLLAITVAVSVPIAKTP